MQDYYHAFFIAWKCGFIGCFYIKGCNLVYLYVLLFLLITEMFHLYRIVYILSFNLWDCVPLVILVPVYMTDSLIVRFFRSVYLLKRVVMGCV